MTGLVLWLMLDSFYFGLNWSVPGLGWLLVGGEGVVYLLELTHGFLSFCPMQHHWARRCLVAWGSSRERKALWSGESRAASACGAFSPGLPTQPAALPNPAPGSWEAV